MTFEMWQFLAVLAAVGLAIGLWIALVWKPRRTGEGEGDGTTGEEAPRRSDPPGKE